jgi:hypothetical protein
MHAEMIILFGYIMFYATNAYGKQDEVHGFVATKRLCK